jgi:hypothetical protein
MASIYPSIPSAPIAPGECSSLSVFGQNQSVALQMDAEHTVMIKKPASLSSLPEPPRRLLTSGNPVRLRLAMPQRISFIGIAALCVTSGTARRFWR